MFSKGTYNRYLFEVDETRRKMLKAYRHLAGQLQDPAMRKVFGDFANDIESEQRTIGGLRGIVQSLT
jgi:hypothetical protein